RASSAAHTHPPNEHTMFTKPLTAALMLTAASTTATAKPYDHAHGDVLYSGTLWQEGERAIEGHWFVDEAEDGTRHLHLGDDFRTKNAPDLKLVLSTREAGGLSKRNVLSGATILGELRSNTGAQSFEIPDAVDLSDIESLAIHCEQYNVFWGAAPFTEGRVVYSSDDWTKKSERIRGSYEIAETESGHVLRTSADFSTKNAPDLKLVLSNHTTRNAKSRNALSGGVVIGKLRSNTGAQQITLPSGISPEEYRTLLIHCERYTKLWGATTLDASG
ncbi:MAG: DM13 domain-containing protein, partial [Planctomycetota bacterium]